MNKEITRLKHYVDNESSLRIYIGKHSGSDFKWIPISSSEGIDYNGISSFVIAYPSGEILDEYQIRTPLPNNLHHMEGPVYQDKTYGFSRNAIDNSKVRITNGVCSRRLDDSNYYSTTITNLSSARIRVYKFGAFAKNLGLFYPREPRNGYYSPRQFIEWYRVENPDGWIDVEESVTDPDNWGTGRGIWAFFFEDENGLRFIGTTKLKI